MTRIEQKKTIDDKTAAMLALTIDDSSSESACISDEVMAAFIDQRLDEAQRATVIKHLTGCSKCRNRCSGTAVAVYEKRKSFLTKRLPVLAAACILIICIYIPFMETSLPTSLVDDSYKNLAVHSTEKGLSARNLAVDLPWEKKSSGYAFNSGTTPAEPQKAFLGGMYSGKVMLTPGEAKLPDFLGPERTKIDALWKGTPLMVTFKLGKWCYLMKVISEKRIETDSRFSENQAQYLSDVIEMYENQPEVEEKAKIKLALTRIKKLQRYFDTAAKTGTGIKWRNLGRETDILVHLMIY